MDGKIVVWLNGWVGHFPIVDAVALVLVSDYFAPVLGSLALLGLWFWGRDFPLRDRHQRAVIVGMAGLGLANLAVMVINNAFFRARPFVVHDLNLALFYQPTDSSFPANAVAVAFAIATGVWGGHRRMGLALAVVAALFGLSRVYAGVSYPSDILGGAAIGVTISLLMMGALRLLEPLPTLVLRLARAVYLA